MVTGIKVFSKGKRKTSVKKDRIFEKKQEDGTYVINFKIHANVFAMEDIKNYINSINPNKTYGLTDGNEIYFNNIFDSINVTMEPYRVQMLGDYSGLTLIEPITLKLLPIDICKTPYIAGFVGASALVNFVFPQTLGMGNRIIVYKCPIAIPGQPRFYSTVAGQCGNLTVIYLDDPKTLIKEVMDYVQSSLTFGISKWVSPNSKWYKRLLKAYAGVCTIQNDPIGYWKNGLQSIRNNKRTRLAEIEAEHMIVHEHSVSFKNQIADMKNKKNG